MTALFAYMGPGAGLGLTGALFGLLLAVLSACGFLLFWPLRVLRNRRRAAAATAAAGKQPA